MVNFLDFVVWGGGNNFGGLEKYGKKSKFSQNLYEIKRIKRDFGKSRNSVSQNRSLGGPNSWK